MLFKSDDASLKLEITQYELPAGTAGEDSDAPNWLVLRCTWIDEEGEIRKDSNSCLLTYELREMTAGLKVVCAGIRERYDSEFALPYFALSAWEAGEDTFRAAVRFILPNTMDGDDTAEVEAAFSREELRALIDELDRLCKKFPDRT